MAILDASITPLHALKKGEKKKKKKIKNTIYKWDHNQLYHLSSIGKAAAIWKLKYHGNTRCLHYSNVCLKKKKKKKNKKH